MSLRSGFLEPRNIYRNAIATSPLLAARYAARRRFSTSVATRRPSRRASRLEASPLSSTPVANSSCSSPSPSSRRAEPSRVTLARRSPRRRSCRPSSVTVLRFAAPGAAQHRPPPPPPVLELGRAPTRPESGRRRHPPSSSAPKLALAVEPHLRSISAQIEPLVSSAALSSPSPTSSLAEFRATAAAPLPRRRGRHGAAAVPPRAALALARAPPPSAPRPPSLPCRRAAPSRGPPAPPRPEQRRHRAPPQAAAPAFARHRRLLRLVPARAAAALAPARGLPAPPGLATRPLPGRRTRAKHAAGARPEQSRGAFPFSFPSVPPPSGARGSV